jgi:hypothetical protein
MSDGFDECGEFQLPAVARVRRGRRPRSARLSSPTPISSPGWRSTPCVASQARPPGVRGSRIGTDNIVVMRKAVGRPTSSVLMATSPRSTSSGPTALLGHDASTALKTAEPEHEFSPTEKRGAQLGPNPARRAELVLKRGSVSLAAKAGRLTGGIVRLTAAPNPSLALAREIRDRVTDFYSVGCRFESCWDRQ